MSTPFSALVLRAGENQPQVHLETLTQDQLPDLPVLVRVDHSTLNYKDALILQGRPGLYRTLPMVPGIDLAGEVVSDRSGHFTPGTPILINGHGLGERHWGGYSRYQRVQPAWITPRPATFSSEQAMAIGTAGYTAMLCVQALLDHPIQPGDGPILITGAAGGVGSFAIRLLSRLGFYVVALSGRHAEQAAYLEQLGASECLPRSALEGAAKPLESERWAGVVDCVGGPVLASALSQTLYNGIVTACGLAGGAQLPTTVMPFILRGVTLRGIDSVQASAVQRERAWQQLAELLTPEDLAGIYQTITLEALPEHAHKLLAGHIRGRIVVTLS